MNVLCRAGLSTEQAEWTMFTLSYYVLGHTIEEQAQADLTATCQWQVKRAAAAEQDAPESALSLGSVMNVEPGWRVSYVLRIFLDGVQNSGHGGLDHAGLGWCRGSGWRWR